MSDVVYRSEVSIERPGGPLRWARIPAESEPGPLGVHGPVAAHYKAREGEYEPHATTLDDVLAAAAG